jgi:hypothetical protein
VRGSTTSPIARDQAIVIDTLNRSAGVTTADGAHGLGMPVQKPCDARIADLSRGGPAAQDSLYMVQTPRILRSQR